MSPRREPEPEVSLARVEANPLMDVLSPELRADLLKAQIGQIDLGGKLTRLKIMGSATLMFEIQDAGLDPMRTVDAVILGFHAANVLWDRPYGQLAQTDEERFPACSAKDGQFGIPREGFSHAGLPGNRLVDGATVGDAVGDGVKQVACATCPYNQWGTGNVFQPNRNPRGKATTNQRILYLLVEGRELPLQLTLPSTSLKGFDTYVRQLSEQGIPTMAVVTRITQHAEGPASNRYGVVDFANQGFLPVETFRTAMEKRDQYSKVMSPQNYVVAEIEGAPSANSGGLDDIPF